MKTLNSRQVAVLKRTAQNNYPLNQKLAKIAKQMQELEDEKTVIEAQIKGFEMGVIALTGGYTSSDLIDRVVLPAVNEDGTQKVDKDGRALTITKYVPKAGVLVENGDGGYTINVAEQQESATGELASPETANEESVTVENQED